MPSEQPGKSSGAAGAQGAAQSPLRSPFASEIAFAAAAVDSVSAPLPPAEQSYADQITNRDRRAQFAAGRSAARLALQAFRSELGTAAIPRSERGVPLWPEGIVGSISHVATVAAAAVGPQERYFGIGLDLERASRMITPRIAAHICLPEEHEWAETDPDLRQQRLVALFSAKEALYKAVHPHWQVFLAFKDARLRYDPLSGAFDAEVLRMRRNNQLLPAPEALRSVRILSLQLPCDAQETLIVSGCAVPRS